MQASIFVILLLGGFVSTREEWIDPHAMEIDLNVVYEKPHQGNKASDTSSNNQYCPKNMESNHNTAYLKRLVNLLMNSAILEKDLNLGVYYGKINVRLEKEDYFFLKDYSKNLDNDCGSINCFQKLDTILTKALAKTNYEKYIDMFSIYGDKFYYAIYNKVTIAMFAVLIMCVFIYKLAQTQYSFWLISKCLFMVFYIIDFSTTYLHLIEAEEIKSIINIKVSGNIPPECNPSKMNWANYFSYLFKTESHCLQYYKATYQNLYYLVTPLKVLNHQFGVAVVGPITYLGTALGGFSQQILSELPWGVNLIILPLIFIFACMLLMILSATISGCAIKFRLFPFFGLEFGSNNGKNTQNDTVSGTNLATLLQTHRKFIEDVKEKRRITNPQPAGNGIKKINKKQMTEYSKARKKKELGNSENLATKTAQISSEEINANKRESKNINQNKENGQGKSEEINEHEDKR